MRKHFTSNYRKMNEADKERYFREKEAYERITGHVLPVAKVRKKRMDLFSHLLLSGRHIQSYF